MHLLDLTSASAELGGRVLLRALTNFANLVLRGEVPQSIKPIFFGANLIPLRKKDGGISPIAVGQTLRRLVAKCISSRVTYSIGSELAPLQLGCGVPLGCEAAAHATRLYLQSMPSNHGAARQSSWSTAVLPNHPTTASEASVSFQCFLSG